MIPDLARHKANAERLIDHYYRPEVAAELAAWVNYVCPVPAARDVLASSDDEETAALAEDPLIFPDAAMRERSRSHGTSRRGSGRSSRSGGTGSWGCSRLIM